MASRPSLFPFLSLLFPALALGLAWAIRGHFGHEWGAAWAGGIAGLAVLLVVPRSQWMPRLPVLALLCAIGWGVGGMMSYGLIVGYGRATDFANVSYGLTMLFVVGGLYGFIGGGFFGLGLETTDSRRPDWANLITQMIAGALLGWGWLIYQLEWFMTPPRSELWASCLGAALALAWYLNRNGYTNALRVAAFAGLGAGFGFGFGNFLQTLGHASGMSFSWWNMMEFSLGFFGGLGMTYGVLSSSWSDEQASPSKATNLLALVTLVLLIPATNLIKAFDADKFAEMATNLGLSDPELFSRNQHLIGWGILLLFATLALIFWVRLKERGEIFTYAPALFFSLTALYILESHIRKGFFAGAPDSRLVQYLYWVDLALLVIVFFIINRKRPDLTFPHVQTPQWKHWYVLVIGVLVLLGLFALISTQVHDGIPGAQRRF